MLIVLICNMAFDNRLKTKDDKSIYKIYHPLENAIFPIKEGCFPKNGASCLSIDIGIRNFAIRREVRFASGNIEAKLFHKIDFSGEKESGLASVNPRVLLAANSFLNSIFHEHIKDCDLVVIERQLPKSPKNRTMFDLVLNFMLSRIGFMKPNVVICDINSTAKSKILKPKVKMTSNELKKWAIDEALRILEKRGDEWSTRWILYHKGTAKTKADDLSDTVIQLEALAQYVNL